MGTDKRARQKAGRQARLAEAQASAAKAHTRRRAVLYGVLALAIAAVIFFIVVVAGGDDDKTVAAPDTTVAAPDTTLAPSDAVDPECPPAAVPETPVLDWTGPPPECIDPALAYTAVFDTTEGEIRVALDTENTPDTVNNFVFLAGWGYYDETLLFRTDPSIDIIQGGSPHTNSASDPGPGYTIADEGTGYTYEPGIIAMARGNAPNSASAQYFFSAGPNTANLDSQGTYVIFGRAEEDSLPVLERILGLHVADNSGLGGAPSREVVVSSVRIEAG